MTITPPVGVDPHSLFAATTIVPTVFQVTTFAESLTQVSTAGLLLLVDYFTDDQAAQDAPASDSPADEEVLDGDTPAETDELSGDLIWSKVEEEGWQEGEGGATVQAPAGQGGEIALVSAPFTPANQDAQGDENPSENAELANPSAVVLDELNLLLSRAAGSFEPVVRQVAGGAGPWYLLAWLIAATAVAVETERWRRRARKGAGGRQH